MSLKIKTKNVSDVIKTTQNIGDNLASTFEETRDLKVCALSLSAYKTAIAAAKAQVIYKKLTGKPTKVAFLE